MSQPARTIRPSLTPATSLATDAQGAWLSPDGPTRFRLEVDLQTLAGTWVEVPLER